MAALEVKGLTGAEIESRWKQLIGRLHTEVGGFAALPSADPRAQRRRVLPVPALTRDPHDAILALMA